MDITRFRSRDHANQPSLAEGITGSRPNAADRPRIMATHRFVRADVVQELSEAYGWQ